MKWINDAKIQLALYILLLFVACYSLSVFNINQNKKIIQSNSELVEELKLNSDLLMLNNQLINRNINKTAQLEKRADNLERMLTIFSDYLNIDKSESN